MEKASLIYSVILSVSLSLCEAEKSTETCGRGVFKLAIFGRKTYDEKWNTSYYLDSSSCDSSENWKFMVQQNVTQIGGMRHVHIRGFFTENVNMTSGYIPTQDVVTDISNGSQTREGDSSGKCIGENGKNELELQIVSRKEWRAKKPTREIATWVEPMDKIYTNYTDTFCLDNYICKLAMLKEQDDGIQSHGDIPYNFYLSRDGPVYEGLGWERRIGDQIKINYFLDEINLPSHTQLRSSRLLIDQGIKLGKISSNFVIIEDSRVSLVSRERLNVTQKYELTIVSREEWNAKQPTKEIKNWVNPLNRVYVGYINQPCFNISMCKLAMANEQNNDVPDHGDIHQNFYSGGDGLVYEGRGWDKLRDSDFNIYYFLDEDKPPSNEQLKSFGLLITRGVRMGKISSDAIVVGSSCLPKMTKKWFSVMKYV